MRMDPSIHGFFEQMGKLRKKTGHRTFSFTRRLVTKVTMSPMIKYFGFFVPSV